MNIGDTFNPYRKFKKIVIIPNVLLRYQSLSSTAKLCWGKLAAYAGKNGECYPSQDRLAEELGKSTVQVKRIIDELKKEHFIRVINPSGKGRLGHINNRYEFLWHKIFEEESEGTTEEPSGRVVEDAPGGIAGDTSIVIDKISNSKKIKEKEKNSPSLSEIKEKIEREVDEIINTRVQKNLDNERSFCDTPCQQYSDCWNELEKLTTPKQRSDKITGCSTYVNSLRDWYADDRKHLVSQKLEQYEWENMDDVLKVKKILCHFIEEVKETRGIKYRLDEQKDIEVIAKFLSMDNAPDYQKLITFYLDPSRCKKSKQEISLSACLSVHTINMYELDRTGYY